MVLRLPNPPLFPAPAADRDARTELPSMNQRSRSIRPRLESFPNNARWIRSHVPSLDHRLNRSCTELHAPKSAGRSLQGAPVAKIHKMPSIVRRWQFQGRPLPPRSRGRRGSTMLHSRSLSPCRAISLPSLQPSSRARAGAGARARRSRPIYRPRPSLNCLPAVLPRRGQAPALQPTISREGACPPTNPVHHGRSDGGASERRTR